MITRMVHGTNGLHGTKSPWYE